MFRAAAAFLSVAVFSVQAAEVYRWVDGSGRVHYTDQPPPATVKQVRTLSGKGNLVEVAKESYEARQAREKNPVTLYAGNCGPLCDDARAFLNQRGIPFTHRDPGKEPEYAVEVRKLTGTLEVPVLRVGKTHQKGFEASSWGSLLDAAGYPRTPIIPPKN
ncbi:MAG TPA: glutaredoxin family protein [Thiobacillaceae bacterium]|nr:glutaredoxin family protein [Thiobacillaceae bacterium]HNU64920.1 glutaredoxin family protein [Thiobacillaceae bacterium]